LSDTKSYFDKHAHVDAYHNDPKMYNMVIEIIKTNQIKAGTRFLDLGCGDGTLIKSANSLAVGFQFLGTDVSYEMIKMARDNLRGVSVDLIVCDGFNLPIKNEFKFGLIHSAYVLHHLIGPTKGKSLNLVSRLLRILAHSLSDNGILIVHEVYYDSYIIPSLTSTMIFYMLKFLNLINLDIRPIIKGFQLGLEVNFMHTAELKRLLEDLGGKIRLVGKDPWIIPTLRRILLLKEQGSITFTYERNNE
jgi:SAM-dependent methyltransferase